MQGARKRRREEWAAQCGGDRARKEWRMQAHTQHKQCKARRQNTQCNGTSVCGADKNLLYCGRVHGFEGWVLFACCTNGGQQLVQLAAGVHHAAAAIQHGRQQASEVAQHGRGLAVMPAQIQTACRRWPLESNTRVQASKPLRGEQTHREAWSAGAGVCGSSCRTAGTHPS